jgi:hypothetical protein
MNNNPYQMLGTTIPPMLGRQRLFDDLLRHLTKPSPDHVSVVGPRHYGKSVILQHLAEQFLTGKGEFVTAAYWDLRHETPDSDATFLRDFASVLKKALPKEFADWIDPTGATVRDDVALAFTEMAQAKKRILVVMDGFDHVLRSTGISRNNWDTMLTFARTTSLRLVSGSRQRLRELCKREDSATSDFWEVFNSNPLFVGRFDERDWDGLLEPFKSRGIVFDGSARKELANYTGGIPVLAAGLLRLAYDATNDNSTLSKANIDGFAATFAENSHDVVADLWDDCTAELQAELVDMQTRRELPLPEINENRRREMELRGLAKTVGTTLRIGSTLVSDYARQQSSGLESMWRLFGDGERFSKNFRHLVELRLNQVQVVDDELVNNVNKAIRDLSHPTDAVTWARRIASRAFRIIWEKELPDNEISLSWIPEVWDGGRDRRIPAGGGACRLLQRATGTDKNPRVTKYVSKRSYALLNFVQSVGDHGQHLDDDYDDVTWSYAAAFCFAAVDLCDSLAKDFDRP